MSPPDPKIHPVWELYDLWRTARFNTKWLGRLLAKYQNLNFWMEVLIAVSTTAAIGSLWFFQGKSGDYVWKIVGAIAALLSIMKPLLRFPDKISLLQELFTGYRVLEWDCTAISNEVRRRQKYDDECIRRVHIALERWRDLIAKAGAMSGNTKLYNQCQEEVNKEMPTTSFYIPSTV